MDTKIKQPEIKFIEPKHRNTIVLCGRVTENATCEPNKMIKNPHDIEKEKLAELLGRDSFLFHCATRILKSWDFSPNTECSNFALYPVHDKEIESKAVGYINIDDSPKKDGILNIKFYYDRYGGVFVGEFINIDIEVKKNESRNDVATKILNALNEYKGKTIFTTTDVINNMIILTATNSGSEGNKIGIEVNDLDFGVYPKKFSGGFSVDREKEEQKKTTDFSNDSNMDTLNTMLMFSAIDN